MNTTSTLAAKSLKGVSWIEAGQRVGYQNDRVFGVTDGRGNWLTFGDVKPGAWDRRSTAAEIAATVDPSGLTWIAEVSA